MRYYLQTQAPAGNWVDSLGTDVLLDAARHGQYLADRGHTVRVIERADRVVLVQPQLADHFCDLEPGTV